MKTAMAGQRVDPTKRRPGRLAIALLPAAIVALGYACAGTRGAEPREGARRGPYALVLGTAQDGGLPQIGCQGPRCEAARDDGSRRRLVASLLLVDPAAGRRFLIDATPDLPEQLEILRARTLPGGTAAAGGSSRPSGRPPLLDGILLTHAHMGHYTGLLHLGPEAHGSRGQTVYVSSRMAAFLEGNAPWSLLVETGALELAILEPGRPHRLTDALEVTPIAVPHRDELSDTLAFLVRGPKRSLLYLPDIDYWPGRGRPGTPIEETLAMVDVALLDGSFFDESELPDRDVSEFPHPRIAESLLRFADLPETERAKVVFTHLNHSNPATDPTSPEARRIRVSGMAVAQEGMVIELGAQPSHAP